MSQVFLGARQSSVRHAEPPAPRLRALAPQNQNPSCKVPPRVGPPERETRAW